MLTGRNHHSNGMGLISELAQGFPGYHAVIPPTNGMLSEILKEQGYATYAIGKWHLTPAEEVTMAGPFDRWPLGRGFDRFYGFLGGETHQYYPGLVFDNHFVEAPKTPEQGYHLTDDLTDRAIGFVRDLRAVDPSKPFFMYFCTGACHAPHQAPPEWIERYRGKFDAGWDAYREATHRRQLELGLLLPGTELSPRPDWVRAWDSLSPDERRLFARQMEVFAGFLSHTDDHIGRLMGALATLDELDNTIIVLICDNGASGEGGFVGSFNEQIFFNSLPESREENLKRYDDMGGPDSYGHYATGWTMAGNTPFKRWKRNVFNGGIADPLIVSWPKGIQPRGEIRHHYTHAVDITPTVLDLLGVEPPAMLKGVPQEQMAGTSFRSTLDDPGAAETRTVQYYELYGSRAIYHNGWKAVTFHLAPGIPADGPGDPRLPFDQDVWELYHVAEDFAENHDLAQQDPARLQALINRWFLEAGKYDVLPLKAEQKKGLRPKPFRTRTSYTYWPGTAPVDNEIAVDVRMRSFTVVALADIPAGGAEGVLIAQGGAFGGWSLFVHDGRLVYEHNFVGLERYRVVSDRPIPTGEISLGCAFAIAGQFEISPQLTGMGVQGVSGDLTLYLNGEPAGAGPIPRTVPFLYSLTGEGLCCGYDNETPVSTLYQSPFSFTGTLHRVVVSVSGEPFSNALKEVEIANGRQ
jgi:arylsulfatase